MGTLFVFDSKDGKNWAQYLGACLHEQPSLSNHHIEYKAHDTFSKDAAESSMEKKEERQVLIFVVTPALMNFMDDNQQCSFEHIVKCPRDTVLILCSVSERDIIAYKHCFPVFESLQKLVLTGTDENVVSVLDDIAQLILHPEDRTQVVDKPPIKPRPSRPHGCQTPSRGSSPASNANSRTSSPTRTKPSKSERSDRQSDFRMFPCKCRCDVSTMFY